MSNGGIGIPVPTSAAIYKSSLKAEMMDKLQMVEQLSLYFAEKWKMSFRQLYSKMKELKLDALHLDSKTET